MPEFPIPLKQKFLEKAEKLRIFPEDIEEQFVRGSGHGGQKMNKTSSTVWLKHGPTGVEVKMQDQRELIANRIGAYRMLILKVEEKMLGKRSDIQKKIFKLRKQKARRTRKSKEKMLAAKAHRSELKSTRNKIQL
ncbi:peptide chain release factor-like protein [Candidatus Peregrinibacteria bacterium]|nr:MAG: peptide chain release factor-like protein [Candidatus Peregrinibacteria bacterium]